MIVVLLVGAALAARRRAPWTAGLQVLAALYLTVTLVATSNYSHVRSPQPPQPYSGPACRSGSINGCP